MQRIERYGVIALVFLLVTILAVSLWGDGERELLAANDRDQAARSAAAPVSDLPIARTSPLASRGARDRALPTSDSSLVDEAARRATGPGAPAAEPEPDRGRRGRRSLPTPETTPAESELSLSRRLALRETSAPHTAVEAPAPPPPGQPQRIAAARTCVVGAGETLSQISQRELGTCRRWPEIAALNGNLDPEQLQQGMVLKLPPRDTARAASVVAAAVAAAAPAAAKALPTPASAPSGTRTYRVRKGDVLGLIAQRELGSAKRWKEIAELNPGVDPERLIVGAGLALPQGGAAQRSAGVAAVQIARAEPSSQTGWGPNSSGGKVR